MKRQTTRLLFLLVLSSALAIIVRSPVLQGLHPINVGGHFQFLTTLGLLMTIITVVFAWKMEGDKNGPLNVALEHLKAATFAIELLITTFYWSCRLVFPGALIPKGLTRGIPLPLDLAIHFLPGVISTLEFIVFAKKQTFKISHVQIIVAFGAFYIAWMHWCFYQNGYWVYPFLADLSTPNRVGIVTVVITGTIVIYLLGLLAHDLLDKPSVTKKVRSPKAILEYIGADKATPARGRKAAAAATSAVKKAASSTIKRAKSKVISTVQIDQEEGKGSARRGSRSSNDYEHQATPAVSRRKNRSPSSDREKKSKKEEIVEATPQKRVGRSVKKATGKKTSKSRSRTRSPSKSPSKKDSITTRLRNAGAK